MWERTLLHLTGLNDKTTKRQNDKTTKRQNDIFVTLKRASDKNQPDADNACRIFWIFWRFLRLQVMARKLLSN
jgi:hypothetical protein